MPIRLLIADRDERLRNVVKQHLAPHGDIEVVASVSDATEMFLAIADTRPDVILLDPAMRGSSAFDHSIGEVFKTKLLIWSVDHHGEIFAKSLRAGATNFAVKQEGNIGDIASLVRRVAAGETVIDDQAAPAVATELLRINSQMEMTSSALQHAREALDSQLGRAAESNAELEFAREALRSQVEQLEERAIQLEFARETLAAQVDELKITYRTTVEALAASVEMRDAYTGGHIERVCQYSLAIANVMDASLTEESLVFGYMLHDIGKLAIPDAVLLKPGKLTDEEFDLIKTHTTEGARYVGGIPFLRDSLSLVRNHHERWDGRGYPDGMEGEQIPRVARIFTLADTLDAMTTDRPYRPALTLEESLMDFQKCAGSQFDPEVVAVFAEVIETADEFAHLRAGVVPGRSV